MTDYYKSILLPVALVVLAFLSGCKPTFVPEQVDLTTLPLCEAVRTVIQQNCASCHGSGQGQGGINYITDPAALVARGTVISGDPENSRLWLRINEEPSSKMPPITSGFSLSELEKSLVYQWILEGALGCSEETIEPLPYIPLETAISWMVEDLRSLPEKPRHMTRYISLTSLANQGVDNTPNSQDPKHLTLSDYRNAVFLMLNSLSWEDEISVPTVVDEAGTILRINLLDYGWDDIRNENDSVALNFWEILERGTPNGQAAELHEIGMSRYPNPILSSSEDFIELQSETRTKLPFINADWLLANASRGDFYHEALNLPKTQAGIEELLGVDLEYNRENGRSLRAGFNDSGVSLHNRLVERMPTKYGSYWLSYDFSNSANASNVFSNPTTFEAAGGEFIFNLPNGLQAYSIHLTDGTRIDAAPQSIVSTPDRPDGLVRNGLSCFNCHGAQGILHAEDMVLDHVHANESQYDDEVVDEVEELHRVEEFAEAQLQDQDLYSQTVDLLGVPARRARLIPQATLKFEEDLDLRKAAAEIGLTPEELTDGILDAGVAVPSFSELLADSGIMKRSDFDEALPSLNCLLAERHRSRNNEDPGHSGCADEAVVFEDRRENTLLDLDFPVCQGPLVTFDEVEPNSSGSTNIISGENGTAFVHGDLIIRGTADTCSNDGLNWTGDTESFGVNFLCVADAEFSLEWAGDSNDMDFRVRAPDWSEQNIPVTGYNFSKSSPEQAQVAEIGGRMFIDIMCWDGDEPPDWTFTIHWSSPVGDDDDSAGDDDDSAGDDDDSAGDDDDSAGDDDDSAEVNNSPAPSE
jgi:hypothetical protein